jgi:release factor glutamine methyltransferase
MKLLIETLTSGADYLAKRGVEDARLNMEHLLAHVLGCRRLDLYLRFDQPLQESELKPLRELTKRRGEGEPLQHLLGTVEFHGLEFISDERALVPRPETEHLVEMLLKKFSGAPPARVLDMGTGSGCIGISFTKAWPKAEVTLADISEDALELARLNAERLVPSSQNVRLLRSDLFEKIPGAFDLIAANLPYIPKGEIPALSREVRRDPTFALDGGVSGLEVVERFVDECAMHLSEDGWIALELGHDQSGRVAERLRSAGFREVEIAADLAGIERFVFARCPFKPAPAPSSPLTVDG